MRAFCLSSFIAAGFVCLTGLVFASAGVIPPDGKWDISAEAGYVVTGGNASASTFSLGTSVGRKWEKDTLALKTFVLRGQAATKTRTAVGTETDFDIIEEKLDRLVAENYLLSGQYDRLLADKFLGQVGFSWDRNRFAGIGSRFMLTAGVGFPWVETKNSSLKTDAALTLTTRRYLGDISTSFAGFRLLAAFERKFNEKAAFTSRLVFDNNLIKAVDWRVDWTNALSAPISRSLSLKTSLWALYSHFPATQQVPLYDMAGGPVGMNVPVPLKKLDLVFTNAIVVSF